MFHCHWYRTRRGIVYKGAGVNKQIDVYVLRYMRGWTFECYMNNWNHTDIKYYFLIAITFILFEAALMDRATLSQCEIVGKIYIYVYAYNILVQQTDNIEL